MKRVLALKAPGEQAVQPLPYVCYFGAVLLLCAAGLAVSVYLAVSHYRLYTDIDYQSFCALTKAINCDTVSQSPYAVIGNLPVAVWGVFGYAGFMILGLLSALPGGRHRRIWALGFFSALAFCTLSLVLAAISAFHIGSYCILCLCTYGINLFLVYFNWLIRRRFPGEKFRPALNLDLGFLWANRRWSIPLLALFFIGLAAVYMKYPAYWRVALPAPSAAIKTGVTSEGHPWIGAESPGLVITEFSDYQCFQCRKMHVYLRRLVARSPDAVRLVHVNYPMDHEFNPIVTQPFHIGSGRMALLAVHAAAAGKFWEMNDRLFERAAGGQTIELKQIAAETGLDEHELAVALKHQPYHQLLLRDIRQGMKLRIYGTPSFEIDGKVYTGSIPAELLSPVIEEKALMRLTPNESESR